MPIKLIFLASSKSIFDDDDEKIRDERPKTEICTGNKYIEKDGNYILGDFSDNAEFEELVNALESYSEMGDSDRKNAEIRPRIYNALKKFWDKVIEEYPILKNEINASNRYLVLIHEGGKIGNCIPYTKALFDACNSCDQVGAFKNIFFSMVSLSASFPKKYWDKDHKLVFPEDDEFPDEIKGIMNELQISVSGEVKPPLMEQIGPELDLFFMRCKSVGFIPKSLLTFLTAILFLVLFYLIISIFPANLRIVPDEGEFETTTEEITMPVSSAERNAINSMILKSVRMDNGSVIITTEPTGPITDRKKDANAGEDVATGQTSEELYHFRKTTRKAAPIQYFHLFMVFFVYVLCCVFCFVICCKLFRRLARHELGKQETFDLVRQTLKELPAADQNEIGKQFVKEMMRVFFQKDEA